MPNRNPEKEARRELRKELTEFLRNSVWSIFFAFQIFFDFPDKN